MFLLPGDHWIVKNTKKKGRGIYTQRDIEGGTVIGDYLGKVIKPSDENDIDESKNFYLMYYHDRASIFPDLTKPGIHLFNNSCTPNCWMYTYRGHTLYFALRHIFAGEELTVSYLVSPQDKYCNPCTHLCKCDSILCTQTMHLSEKRYKEWAKIHDEQAKKTKREPIKFGTDLPPLSSYPKNITDHPIYTLYGALHKEAYDVDGKKMPSVFEIRKLIRKTGRTLKFKALNLHVLGILDYLIISEPIT